MHQRASAATDVLLGGVVLHRGAVGQGDARMGTAREKA